MRPISITDQNIETLLKLEKEKYLEKLKDKNLPREALIDIVKDSVEFINKVIPENWENDEIFTTVYLAIIKNSAFVKTIMALDENGTSYEDAAECLTQFALIHKTIAKSVINNIGKPLGGKDYGFYSNVRCILESERSYKHLSNIAQKHKVYFDNYNEEIINKKLDLKRNYIKDQSKNENLTKEELINLVNEWVDFVTRTLPKPIGNAMFAYREFRKAYSTLLMKHPIFSNMTSQEKKAEFLTQLALIHPTVSYR